MKVTGEPLEPKPTTEQAPPADMSPAELLAAVAKLSAQLERQTTMLQDWKFHLRNGVLAGFGGVVGATVVVSIIVYVLQPFKQIQTLGPMIERLDTTLKQSRR